MKRIIIWIGLTLFMLSAFSKGDQLYQLYVQHDQAKYYLSAPYGGGDELVTKKLSKQAGANEAFTLEYIVTKGRRAPGSARQCRIKTHRNYYVSLTGYGELMAEDKKPGPQNLFEVTSKLVSTKTFNEGGNTVTRRIVSLTISKNMLRTKWYLSFDPTDEVFEMARSTADKATSILGQTGNVEIKTAVIKTGFHTTYQLKWLKANPYDRRPIAPAYLQVSYGKYSPRNRTPPITHIWKTNTLFEPVKYIPNMVSISLRTRKNANKAVKLEGLQLYKNGKYYKQWKLNTQLQPGQRLVLFMDGSFRVY